MLIFGKTLACYSQEMYDTQFGKRSAKQVKQLILLLDSEGICSSSDGKNSVCSAGDPGSILGQEDPMEKGMAPSLVFLPGEIHG